MNCYIVLTNEGRDRSPSFLLRSRLLPRRSLVPFSPVCPQLPRLVLCIWTLSSLREQERERISSLLLLLSKLGSALSAGFAERARSTCFASSYCFLYDKWARAPSLLPPPCSARLEQPRTPAPFEGSDLPLDPSIATRNTPPEFLPNSNPFPLPTGYWITCYPLSTIASCHSDVTLFNRTNAIRYGSFFTRGRPFDFPFR